MPDQDRYSSQERLIIVLVVLLAIVTIVFGFWGIKKSINLPFSDQGKGDYRTPEERQAEAMTVLKQTDTDRDGISDYDEHYVFRTNPYLEDTDSDGLPDGKEIAGNTDPNCPDGNTCRTVRTSTGTGSQASGEDGSAVAVDAQTLTFIETFGDPRELTREQAEAKVQALSSAAMRSFFIRMGVSQEAVDKADDDALRQLAMEALKEITFANDSSSGSGEQPAE